MALRSTVIGPRALAACVLVVAWSGGELRRGGRGLRHAAVDGALFSLSGGREGLRVKLALRTSRPLRRPPPRLPGPLAVELVPVAPRKAEWTADLLPCRLVVFTVQRGRGGGVGLELPQKPSTCTGCSRRWPSCSPCTCTGAAGATRRRRRSARRTCGTERGWLQGWGHWRGVRRAFAGDWVWGSDDRVRHSVRGRGHLSRS